MGKVEGNWDQFTKDVGLGMLKRTMMRGANWGVGAQKQSIELKGDVMHIHTMPMDTKSEHQLNGSTYTAEIMNEAAANVCTYTADCITLTSTLPGRILRSYRNGPWR